MLWENDFRLPLEFSFWHSAEIGTRRASSTISAVRELIRRGVVALPEILTHIDDRRPTRMMIRQNSPIGSFSLSNWMDPRFRRNETQFPAGIPAIEAETTSHSYGFPVYTVTVGDVCYFVVGQIVNRDLQILHRRMTHAILITSPTASPVLADAVRSDWSGVTATEHRQSLVDDARQWRRPGDAIQRLALYYPDEVEEVALELLERPLYYTSPSDGLVVDLLKTDERGDWNLLFDNFREKHGNSMELDIQSGLHAIASERLRTRESDWDNKHRRRAIQILSHFYAGFDSRSAATPTHSTYAIQTSVVSGLCMSPASERVNVAVYRVFEEANAAAFRNEFVRQPFDLLAIACIRRLAGTSYDTALLNFIDERISAIDKLPRSIREKTCGQEFRNLRASLQKQK
jgi:hypothetical protein